MKKQHNIRTGIITMLFFVFSFAKAGLTTTVTPAPACNGSDGSVTITASGETGPYGFWITGNGVYQADSNITASTVFTGLAPGTYQYVAYSALGNQQTGTFIISSVDNGAIAITQPVCPVSTTGSAVVTGNGGVTPYTYLWSNGSTNQSVTGLAQGLVWVTVTDHNGCQAIATDTVYIISTVQVNLTQTGPVCSSTITANPSGGIAPYSYVWSNNQTTASVTGLANGNQYVVITDAAGCEGTAYTYINNPSLNFDSINTVIIQPSCGSNGSISVVMASGLAPYTYSWSNGATTAAITNLTSYTNYYVTVTDANGCTGQTYYYISGYSLNLAHSAVNPDCGTTGGTIQLYISGGNPPYTIVWSNDVNNHTTFDSLLSAGNYYDTVTDANGCRLTDSVRLIPQGNFSARVNVSPILCPATTGGSMAVNVSGAGPYTYVWSNGATTQTLSNLPEGVSYSVTVNDNNGCEAVAWSDSVSVAAPFTVSLSSTACAGTITANITGNTGPYNYLWSTGATTAGITFVLYNNYNLTVTDVHGCAAYQNFYAYTSGLQLDSFNSQVNPTCNALGGIKANPLNGVAPYTYLWSNGATTDSIGGLAAGSYSVTITDANGCTGVGYYYLNAIIVGASYNQTNPGCGASNGSITLYPYNGTAPYSYLWSNNSTGNALTGLGTGTYAYTVTDANGCSFTSSYTLTAQGQYTVNVAATPTGCDPSTPTGQANVTVINGGMAPFSFTWQERTPDGGYFDTITQSGLTGLPYGTGVWLLSVEDANGCIDSAITFTGSDSSGVSIDYASTCYDNITGYVYTDLNGNCIKDAGEPGLSVMNIVAAGNGTTYYSSTDSNGFYDIQVLAGTYSVYPYSNGSSCLATPCTNSYTQTLTGIGAVSAGNDFGYSNNPGFDLVVHTGYDPSTPGSTKQYWVYYYNQGAAAVNNAVLTFVHDPNLMLTSTSPTYSSYDVATQTITWNLGAVPSSQWINLSQQVIMEFNVPSNLPLGTLLTARDSIAPTVGDCNVTNNVQYLADVVSASHDPNSKEVSPAGNITPGDSVLNYTIRFQNTGNAAATKIIIVDTLSPLVNPASLVVGASNFPYTYTLSGTGIITFIFYPINLPDSAQSADSSKGFVSYSVTIKNSTPAGAQIKNTANIYFDLNPAIVTNTTISTLSESSVGLRNITAGNMSVTVSPNPVYDKSLISIKDASGEVLFEITDIMGQKILEKTTSDDNIVFESGTFAAGIYIYTARDAKGNTSTGKIVIAH